MFLFKLYEIIIDAIYPRRCPVCDRPCKPGTRICVECERTLVHTKGALCLKCGKKLLDEADEYCNDCRDNKHIYKAGRSLYEYNSINKSLYRFKYSNRAEYGDYYGNQLACKFGEVIKNWGIEMIVPVPLHKTRMKKRGYNQAGILAKKMAAELKLPYCEDLLIRIRKTKPMKELDAGERQINLKNAFIVGYNDVKLNRVLIVDDIYTTGSTIDAVAEAMIKEGVSEVYFVALSIGSGI